MYKGQEMWQIETHTHIHTGVLSTKAVYAHQRASMLVKYEMRLQMSASAKATKYPLCYDWFLCCNSLNLIKKFCVWC